MYGSRWVARVASVALLAAGGCCSAPLAQKYFARQEPYETTDAFAYAVDAGQYDYAYDCLTPESQKLFTRSLFKFALRFNVTVEELKVPIRDLVLGADRAFFRIDRDPGSDDRRHKRQLLQYRFANGDLFRFYLYLVQETEAEAGAAGREDPVWLIDFEKSVREIAGADFSLLVS